MRLLKLECCLACTSDQAMRTAPISAGKWRVKSAVTGSGAYAANHFGNQSRLTDEQRLCALWRRCDPDQPSRAEPSVTAIE